MNIGVYIETGGINTLTVSDSIIDQLAALDCKLCLRKPRSFD